MRSEKTDTGRQEKTDRETRDDKLSIPLGHRKQSFNIWMDREFRGVFIDTAA